MKNLTVQQVVVILATAAMIVVNALANALPINGQTTGEISDRFEVFFVPAGYVFSIWGLIYLGLIAYSVYQALPGQQQNPRLKAIGWLYVGSAAANIAWIFLWHYNAFVLTLIAMLALLGLLIAIYMHLAEEPPQMRSWGERLLVQLPFSIYLGWITVATMANVTDVLYYLGWGGWGIDPQVWAVVLLVAATVVAGLMAYTRHDVAYLLVLVWAFAGIAVKQAGAPLVANSAWVATGVAALFVVASLVLRPRLMLRTRGSS